MSALDRINKLNNNTEKPTLSLDAQMALANELEDPENEEFFGGMSEEAKSSLSKSFQKFEVKLEKEKNPNILNKTKKEDSKEESNEKESETEEKSNELFNNNSNEPQNKNRGRPKKEQNQMEQGNSSIDYTPIMDRLAKQLIDDLKNKKYSVDNFSEVEMNIIFDYIYSKL